MQMKMYGIIYQMTQLFKIQIKKIKSKFINEWIVIELLLIIKFIIDLKKQIHKMI